MFGGVAVYRALPAPDAYGLGGYLGLVADRLVGDACIVGPLALLAIVMVRWVERRPCPEAAVAPVPAALASGGLGAGLFLLALGVAWALGGAGAGQGPFAARPPAGRGRGRRGADPVAGRRRGRVLPGLAAAVAGGALGALGRPDHHCPAVRRRPCGDLPAQRRRLPQRHVGRRRLRPCWRCAPAAWRRRSPPTGAGTGPSRPWPAPRPTPASTRWAPCSTWTCAVRA